MQASATCQSAWDVVSGVFTFDVVSGVLTFEDVRGVFTCDVVSGALDVCGCKWDTGILLSKLTNIDAKVVSAVRLPLENQALEQFAVSSRTQGAWFESSGGVECSRGFLVLSPLEYSMPNFMLVGKMLNTNTNRPGNAGGETPRSNKSEYIEERKKE